MAISLVGTASAQTASETLPSTTFINSVLPSGIAANDLILIAVHRQQNYAIASTPSGYTLLDNVIDNGTSPAAADTDIYYRIASGTETTTGPTFSTATAARFIAHAAVYRGVNTSTPFIAHSGQATASSTNNRAAPAITNTNAAAWAVFATGLRNVASPVSFTPPSGMTERQDSDIGMITTGSINSNLAAEWADTNGTVGSTGAITYTATSSGAASAIAIAWAAFLNPASGVTVTGLVIAAGVGAATVTGFVTVVGAGVDLGQFGADRFGSAPFGGLPAAPLRAAGTGSATALGLFSFSGALTGAGRGTGALGFGFGATASGTGGAAVTGFATRADALSAGGGGAATVSGRLSVLSVVAATGVGGATVLPGGTGAVAISLVGTAAAQTSNETAPSTSSITSALPASIIADDLILIAVHRQQDYTLVGSPPTGYTLLDNVLDLGTSPSAAQTDVFYRFADGSETTTGPTFSLGTNLARFITHAAVYRGVSKTAPFIAHSGQDTASGTATASRAAPAISNTDTRAWGVFATATKNIITPVTFTPPSGMTERQDADTGVSFTGTSSGNLGAEWADTNGTIGSTGSVTYTATSSGTTVIATAWAAFLKPTAGSATQTGIVVSAGAGHATVSGFVADTGLSTAAGVGAANATGPVVVVISSAGAGAAAVTVTTALVTVKGVAVAAGVGTAAVAATRTQSFAATAAGVGAAVAGGVGVHQPDTVLAAFGLGVAVIAGTELLVAPSHVATTAVLAFNGISDAVLLVVPPGESDLDDLGALPDAALASDGTSTATVLPVAPGVATVQTT